MAAAAASGGKKVVVKEGLRYNPLSPDVFYETSKVVGSNSTRLAGQVIVGVSAAFLVWDAIGEMCLRNNAPISLRLFPRHS